MAENGWTLPLLGLKPQFIDAVRWGSKGGIFLEFSSKGTVLARFVVVHAVRLGGRWDNAQRFEVSLRSCHPFFSQTCRVIRVRVQVEVADVDGALLLAQFPLSALMTVESTPRQADMRKHAFVAPTAPFGGVVVRADDASIHLSLVIVSFCHGLVSTHLWAIDGPRLIGFFMLRRWY